MNGFKVCLLASFSLPHLTLPVVAFHHFSTFHFQQHYSDQKITITWSHKLLHLLSCAKTFSPLKGKLQTLHSTLYPSSSPDFNGGSYLTHHNITFSIRLLCCILRQFHNALFRWCPATWLSHSLSSATYQLFTLCSGSPTWAADNISWIIQWYQGKGS